MLLFTALAEATHFSPKRQSWTSAPFCLEGLGQDMEQSPEIFIDGMDNRVAPEVLPGLGPIPSQSLDLGAGAKGSGWIYVTSRLRPASAPARHEPAVFPDPRSRREAGHFTCLPHPSVWTSKYLHKLQRRYLLLLRCASKGACAHSVSREREGHP